MPQIVNGAFCGDPSNMWDTTSVWTTDFYDRIAARRIGLAHWYQDWERSTRKDWDEGKVRTLTARGELPMISWAPRDPNLGTSDPTYNHAAILAGTHDAYITSWAEGIKAYGQPLLLRTMWEMNITVYSWSIGVQSQTNTTYKNAFQYLVNAFDAIGVPNVRWVWCPYVSASDHSGYYPGDAYVDYLGLDGYNNQASTTWQTFTQVFGASYTNLTGTVAPTKPLIICEVGSMETNGDKAAWILDMYDQVQSTYPKIKGLVYFDADFTSSGQKDWSLESTTTARDAYRDAANNPENLNVLETGVQYIEATSATTGGTNALSISASLPSSRTTDDIMIAFLGKGQYYQYGSAPSGWSKFFEETDSGLLGGGNARIEGWWKRVAGGETTPTWTVTDGAATAGVHTIAISLWRGCKKTGDPFEGVDTGYFVGALAAGDAVPGSPVRTTEEDRRVVGFAFTRMASASPVNAGYTWPSRFTEEWELNHLTAGTNASTQAVAHSFQPTPDDVLPSASITNPQDRYITATFALIPEPPNVAGRVEEVLVQKNLGGRALHILDTPASPGEYGLTYW